MFRLPCNEGYNPVNDTNLAWFGLGALAAFVLIAYVGGRQRKLAYAPVQAPQEKNLTQRPHSHFLARLERQISFPN